MQDFTNILDLIKVFSDEKKCHDHLKKIIWSNGSYCPHCGNCKIYDFSDGITHKCSDCRKKFSIKVWTIFEDSKVPLQKWFIAIFLLTSHKKGISSLQLAKDIWVTQKTAWFILQRLRKAMETKDFSKPLSNIV